MKIAVNGQEVTNIKTIEVSITLTFEDHSVLHLPEETHFMPNDILHINADKIETVEVSGVSIAGPAQFQDDGFFK